MFFGIIEVKSDAVKPFLLAVVPLWSVFVAYIIGTKDMFMIMQLSAALTAFINLIEIDVYALKEFFFLLLFMNDDDNNQKNDAFYIYSLTLENMIYPRTTLNNQTDTKQQSSSSQKYRAEVNENKDFQIMKIYIYKQKLYHPQLQIFEGQNIVRRKDKKKFDVLQLSQMIFDAHVNHLKFHDRTYKHYKDIVISFHPTNNCDTSHFMKNPFTKNIFNGMDYFKIEGLPKTEHAEYIEHVRSKCHENEITIWVLKTEKAPPSSSSSPPNIYSKLDDFSRMLPEADNWNTERVLKRKDNLFLPENFPLFTVVQNFIDRASWYEEKGIVYNLGLLFYGPPGNGKTSAIKALAYEFNAPLISISCGTITCNDDLIKMFDKIKSSSLIKWRTEPFIIALEDIDRSKLFENITLDIFLNLLSGIGHMENRILIFTCNDEIELINNPALMRPGRIDHAIKFENADQNQIQNMLRHYFTEKDESKNHIVFDFVGKKPISTAKVEECCICYPNYQEAIQKILELTASSE